MMPWRRIGPFLMASAAFFSRGAQPTSRQASAHVAAHSAIIGRGGHEPSTSTCLAITAPPSCVAYARPYDAEGVPAWTAHIAMYSAITSSEKPPTFAALESLETSGNVSCAERREGE